MFSCCLRKGGSKFNALCEVGFSSGVEYFEVEVVEGSGAFVGVTSKAGFGEGYKIKGLFFGGPGNLSDGGAGLRINFGDAVKKGSVIGVTLDLTEEAMVGVSFWQGDTCLGEAFKACPRQPGASVFPAVCANNVHDRFKLSLKRVARKPVKEEAHPAEGAWDLQRFLVGEELVNLDPALAVKGKGKGKGYAGEDGEETKGHIVMTIKKQPLPRSFGLSMKLGNNISTSAPYHKVRKLLFVQKSFNYWILKN